MTAARQAALTAAAVAGVLCILVTVAGLAFGVRPLVFRSGSMAPAIDTGALAIAHPVGADELRRGDVVSVPTPGGDRVTHRIVSIEHTADRAVLRLKGDANQAPDASPYVVAEADVVLFSVPWVGRALARLTSPAGLFLLGLYAAYLMSVIVRGTSRRPPSDGGRHTLAPPSRRSAAGHRGARSAVTVPLAAVTLLAGVLAQDSTKSTLAAWADPVAISGTTETAYTVPAPDGTSCAAWTGGTSSSRGVNLSWPTPTKATSYTTAVAGIAVTSKSVVTVGSNQELRVRYNPATLTNLNRIATVTATPWLTSTATWAGPVTSWKFRTGGSSALQPICGDATPAVVVIRAPDGVTRTPTAERAFIVGATGCTFDIGLCGTIQDASTIASVRYVLKRVQGGNTRCFNGTSWVLTCNQITALSTVYQNQLTFYEDANTSTVYPNTGIGSYTLTVTVTDSWQNVTTTAVSFTLI